MRIHTTTNWGVALARAARAVAIGLALAGCSEDPGPTGISKRLPRGAGPTFQLSANGPAVMVSAGGSHTCALRSDGTLTCWDIYGGDIGAATPPAGSFTQVSGGGYHFCALRTDGALACWGETRSGQTMPPAGSFTQVSASGIDHACALAADGDIACWGHDGMGQATPPAGTFTQVSAGGAYGCALRMDGTIACWGLDHYRQATPPAGSFVQVSAGLMHTCALSADGTVTCWGNNDEGRATPPAGIFTAVSAGAWHTCALRLDGSIACWGNNSYGQATPPAGTFRQISGGVGFHSCALRADGTVACWGAAGYIPPELAGNAPQSITFTSTPPAPALPGGTYLVTATGGASENPVVFSTLTPEVCAASGSTVSLLAVGTCTLAAYQAGGPGYAAAPQTTQSFGVVYPFTGFFLPVRNPPAVSLGLAGLPVLVPFSLGGDRGLGILASGSPALRPIDCTTKAPLGDLQPTAAAGVGLYYVGFAKRYVYAWKTESAWAGTCRELVVTLNDGTDHRAIVRFVARDEDDN